MVHYYDDISPMLTTSEVARVLQMQNAQMQRKLKELGVDVKVEEKKANS